MSAANSLCLACSSSLPPKLTLQSPQSKEPSESCSGIFTTNCCNRPICPNCLSSNPRLTRYNPCLQCLAGTAAVCSTRSNIYQCQTVRPQARVNIDGGIQDEDVFTLGDDDDVEGSEYDSHNTQTNITGRSITASRNDQQPLPSSTPPPAYDTLENSKQEDASHTLHDVSASSESSLPCPLKYYIQPTDTLLGIAFKYKVDPRLLCRLNNLPPTTLQTTPHILHTRTVLTLPPSVNPPPSSQTTIADSDYEARRARERSERRFQIVTKEVDPRVAKAYVALSADLDSETTARMEFVKPLTDKNWNTMYDRDKRRAALGEGSSSLEATAIDRYLDDEDWERSEREQGRGVSIPRFPLFGSGAGKVADGDKPAVSGSKMWSGWRWK
ncbi:hypothetical protein BC835DRAFT_1363551 [Cytidiella melzeri]|nr:hypothetical protein BC835DRAFT_1363551 [Cytidiella melzeri]